MNCESKKISELPGVVNVYPEDIIPIVQNGENKFVKVADLLCKHHHHDSCGCEKALFKAVEALDISRTAIDFANKAYDKVCLLDAKVSALDRKVSEMDTIICNIQSLITQIFNRFNQLENTLRVTLVESPAGIYTLYQGGDFVGQVKVLQPTININELGQNYPADAWAVRQALNSLKSEVTHTLTFVAGKFNPTVTYNGLENLTVNIPRNLSDLNNDGLFLTGVKKPDGTLAQVDNNGVANLSPFNLDGLSNVTITNPSDGDVLYYDGTKSKWVNVPIAQLIIDNLDCDAVRACIGNFEVAPLVINLDYNNHNVNGTPFVVTTDGAWQIHKLTGSNDFSANIPDDTTQTGNGLFLVTTSTDNTGSSPREATWNVVPLVGTPVEVKIILAANQPTPTVDRTITYNISGGQTNSIKVNNEVVGNGDQKTAPDGSNYTVSIVSNDPGYRIANVTPAGIYDNNGTLTINPITSNVTVLVTLELIPAGTHNVTYVVDGDASKILNLPNSPVTVTNGLSYSYTPTIELGYEIPVNGVTFNPNGNGTYNGTAITIPQEITTNTEVIIRVVAEGLAVLTVTPISLEIEPEGTTNPEIISVSTTCTTSGITINDDSLPSGITVTLNSAQTEIEVTVNSSVAAGDYTFTVSDNCGNTKTVTITKKEELSVNLFENINFGNSKFNAFGVVEERFNNSQPIALNPEVNDPYRANTYANGSMYYLADLGTWESIHSNIDPSLPINLTQTVADLYLTEPPAGVNKIDWLKDSQLVLARLAAIKDNTNLIYSDYSILLDNIGTDNPNNIIPAEYGLKQGAANERPFYVVIAENTTSITLLSDLWLTHVYVQLWCMPTDFTVTHPDDLVPLAYYIWEDSHHNELFIGVVWEYQNYKMEHYFKDFRREEYKLHPYYNERYNYDPICNTVYVNGDFYCPISYGGINNNHEDITVSHNPTIAAFTKTTYDNKEFPNYTVIVYDSNNQLVNNIQSLIVSDSGTYCLHVSGFPNIEEQYKIEITATSTGLHPSLTWSYNIYVSDSGVINEPKFGLDNVSQSSALLKYGYTRAGGYYGTSAGNREPGIDGPMYASSTSNLERVGSGCAIRLADINLSSAVITAGTKTTTINSSSFISWGTEENYNTVLNTAFTTHETMCPPDPLVFKGQKTINGTVTDVIELYIPYVSLNTVITIS